MSSNGINVEVKGIYSTAITKILMDNNYSIVKPSIWLQERLDLDDLEKEPDIIITNKQDYHGVRVKHLSEELLFKSFKDTIIDSLPFSIFFKRSSNVVDIDFPLPMKRTLDKFRGHVIQTIQDHHYLKAFGGQVASAVDMAERLLMKGRPYIEVNSKLSEIVLQHLPYEGSILDVVHVKLNGFNINLGKAVIFSCFNDELLYKRKIQSDGVYDGLGIRKDSGDEAVSKTNGTDYFIDTKYFSKSGKLKGTYFNINTPVEVYSSTIRYIDLELDVLMWTDGSLKVVDSDKLEKAENEGIISKLLGEKTRGIADFLMNKYT
jgi:hypothetical protein